MARVDGLTKRGKGRPKGAQSKITRDAREMLELAAEGAGGLTALTQLAVDKPEIFWPMWGRSLIPKDVKLNASGKLIVEIVHDES